MTNLQRLITISKIVIKLAKFPASIFLILKDETEHKSYLQKKYGKTQFPTVDINQFFVDGRAEINHYTFLDGSSLATDLALLKSIAASYPGCEYMEIGTWRGESILNVADTGAHCTSVNLSPEDIIAMGLDEKYAHLHGCLIKDKSKIKTFIARWGGIGMASSELFSKMKNTNIEKYGVEYYSQSADWYKKCVETAMDKYGKEWVSKVDTINVKQQSGGYSYYDFEFPSGKVVRVQGYEPKVLAKLIIDYSEDDIVVGVQNIIDVIGFFHYVYEGETHRYYPDIYIKSENKVIEVKSTYTFNKEKEKNLLKRESVLNKNINFKFIIL